MASAATTGSSAESHPASLIEQNIEAILALHTTGERELTRQHRAVERAVAIIAIPAFLVGALVVISLWIAFNLALQASGKQPIDPPPFGWLQTVVSVLSLLIMVVVVITQGRQGKISELNSHVDLQVNLLVDQKAAKIIKLLEEMRADSPTLRDRHDEEAEILQHTVDPADIAALITDKMAETVVEAIADAMDEPPVEERE